MKSKQNHQDLITLISTNNKYNFIFALAIKKLINVRKGLSHTINPEKKSEKQHQIKHNGCSKKKHITSCKSNIDINDVGKDA